MLRLKVNGTEYTVDDAQSKTPLLWVLRDRFGLVGTKYGCGIGYCGTCTVHMDGQPVRSCSLRTGDADGREITTIEGLAGPDADLHPLQKAWIDYDVPQCGYCQAGQLMSAAALLADNPTPSDADIDAAMSGNICRCATYKRIRQAIHAAASALARQGDAA